ncbi:MAG: restriction endonuclease subunit S, partial [Pseudanabaena sp.]
MSKDLAGLPKGWKVVRLGEISKDIQSGGTPLRNQKSFYEGSIPWVKTLDLNEGVVNCTEEKITEEGFKSIRGKLRPINTVMVAMYGGSGTVGKTGILGISAATNQAVCCIEPNPKVFDSVYLHFYLIGVRKEWMRYAIGTRKDPNISKGIIENTEIILPPLEEQMAIATTLRTIQTAKEARQKELALERERKAALMDYLFTHGTRNEPRKQTELGEIPESWNISKFGQLVEMKNGINFKTEQKGKGILTIDVFNMYSGSIYLVMNKLYRVDVPDIREHFLLQPNDILFVRSSLKEEGVGWASLFRGFDELVTFCGFIIRARLLTNDFIPEYLL